MNLTNNTELEAACLLRRILPESICVSLGVGKTHEGGNAPDIVIHKPEDVLDGFIKHSTIGVHALLTKSYTYQNYWKFTLIDRAHVHDNLAYYAPDITGGIDMAVRKRPAGTNKDTSSINYGKANIDHAVYFKPQTEDSLAHAVFYQGEDYTYLGCAIATAIDDHVRSYGPLVIDVKGGSLSQLANVTFVADRACDKAPIQITIESSSLPAKTKLKLIEHVSKHLQEKIHKYLDDISAIVGRPVHSTKIRKYRTKMNGVYIIPRDDLDLPEEALKHVPFYHIIGTEEEATEGVKLSFNRIATGYKLEEYNAISTRSILTESNGRN